MNQRFYRMPLRFDFIMNNESAEQMETCSELESIDRHIELLLTTCPGEHKFDKNFGCRIWDMDFERVVSRKKWEEDFTICIKEAVEKFEPRLTNVSAFIQIMEVTREDIASKSTAIKKKVTVHIKAKLISTNEYAVFKYIVFLGPLSTE